MPDAGATVVPDAVAPAYDRWSPSYESVGNATRDLADRMLRGHALELTGRNLLERGCGTGLNSSYLAQHGRSLVAPDFTEGLLAQARARTRADHVRFGQRDIRGDWVLPPASVDLVVCMLVLEHIEQLGPVFSQTARVLRPGGEMPVGALHPYRQLRGGQARCTDSQCRHLVRIPALQHDLADYLNPAARHGLALLGMQEPRDPGQDPRTAAPRLLCPHLRRANGPGAAASATTTRG